MNKLFYSFFIFSTICFSQQQITETLFFDGQDREYIIYVPEIYDGTLDVPVLFSFHGGSGYASDFIQTNDMRPLADTANFIAVYPQGAIDPEGGTTSWIHKAPTDHDDIFFVEPTPKPAASAVILILKILLEITNTPNIIIKILIIEVRNGIS
jgi:hypothetical protein